MRWFHLKMLIAFKMMNKIQGPASYLEKADRYLLLFGKLVFLKFVYNDLSENQV
jgi:hypothetical protein